MNFAVTEFTSAGALPAEWDALAGQTGASPFVRPGWVEAWWSAFGQGELYAATVHERGRLVAVAPVVRDARGTSSPTNWHSPEFELVAASPEAAAAAAHGIAALPGRRLRLGFLNSPDAGVWIDAARKASRRVIVTTLERSPYVAIDGDWDAYLQTVPKHRVAELRRRERRLRELGELDFDVESGGAGLEDALEEGLRLEGSGWKLEQGTAILSQPETAAFYRDVARWAAPRDWLRLCFLRLDGRAIAFQYVVEVDGVAYFLKGGYDPDFKRYAPGVLLARDVLARAFRIGLRRYEFLGTDDAFKLDWAREVRDRLRVQAFATSATGLVDWAAWSYGRPAAKRLLAAARRA